MDYNLFIDSDILVRVFGEGWYETGVMLFGAMALKLYRVAIKKDKVEMGFNNYTYEFKLYVSKKNRSYEK